MPLSLRAEMARPAHSPYKVPPSSPNRPQTRPVRSALFRKPRKPPPAAPAMAPNTSPNPPHLITSLLAMAATP
jgi:hypothetical protein